MSIKNILSVALFAVIFASCSTPKNIAYFQGTENEEITELVIPSVNLIKVQPHDKLSIVVKSKDPALAQLFNLNVVSNYSTQKTPQNGTGSSFRDYTVPNNEGISAYTVSAEGT
ncbi:MAG: polysaccharide export protein, partial [Muribaculaceae bacterium]|nr:polysaccharide export protein [Muribaculaceae bacterium]